MITNLIARFLSCEEQTENQIITKVLCTLPPSFKSVILAWEKVKDPKKKLPLLTTRLLKETNKETSYIIYFLSSTSRNPKQWFA
jgi:hypothetical protein